VGAERAGDQEHQGGGGEERGGVYEERQRESDDEQERAGRRTDKGVHDALDAPDAAIGRLELVGPDDVGQDRLVGVVAQHLGHADQHGGRQHHQEQTGPGSGDGVDLVGAGELRLGSEHRDRHRQGENAPHHVHGHHGPPPVDPIGDHAGR
jgi:hypothetical protein